MLPEFMNREATLEIKNTFSFVELEKRLRRVQLNDKAIADFYPYLHADISLQTIPIDVLHPSALYVLKDNLDRIGEVGRLFTEKGIDIFSLNSEISIVDYNYEERECIVLGPPIVEESKDDSRILIITDGLHRVTMAKMEGRKSIVVAKIEKTAAPLPVLPVEWDEVKIKTSVPTEKRRYRFDSHDQIKRWKAENYPRFIQGFNFPELEWQKGIYPEISKGHDQWWGEVEQRDSVAVIVRSGEKVLMVERADSGLWGLPSGHVEVYDKRSYEVSGMSPRRELFEETGLIALKWRNIGHIFKNLNIGIIYEAKVIDKTHVDMNLEDYIFAFNQSTGNLEVSKLRLFSLKEVKKLNSQGQLFKPEYNMTALGNYFEKREDGRLEEVSQNFAPWDGPDAFWHSQESFTV